MKTIDEYIPESHKPHANALRSLFIAANKSLIQPEPATRLAGFQKLMMMTGGFRPFEFTILCGSTGSGKTTLCANISSALIDDGVPHFVASVETGALDFIRRVMSAKAGKDWNTGDAVSVDELRAFHVQHGGTLLNQESLQLSLYDNRFSVETLMADIAWMVKHKGVKIALIDNLNFFLEATSAANQVIEMDRVIHELIIFCKRVEVHLIMVMHPKKTDSGRIESENDIKGSSTANQEAHNILLWNRAHPELIKAGEATETDREILIAKMRRKGKWVRKRLIMQSINGVAYREGNIY